MTGSLYILKNQRQGGGVLDTEFDSKPRGPLMVAGKKTYTVDLLHDKTRRISGRT
jgi:hypothetical protein